MTRKQQAVLLHDPIDPFVVDTRPVFMGPFAIEQGSDAPVAVGRALVHQGANALNHRRIGPQLSQQACPQRRRLLCTHRRLRVARPRG